MSKIQQKIYCTKYPVAADKKLLLIMTEPTQKQNLTPLLARRTIEDIKEGGKGKPTTRCSKSIFLKLRIVHPS